MGGSSEGGWGLCLEGGMWDVSEMLIVGCEVLRFSIP